MDSLFNLLPNVNSTSICLLIVGITLVISFVYTFIVSFKLESTKSFFVTSILTPMIVAAIISMVAIFLDNTTSNAIRIASIAVALGLIRFRSINGRAEELLILFTGVGVGSIAGLGYVVFAAILGLSVSLLYVFFTSIDLFDGRRNRNTKLLRITIPEDLDYSGVFDDVFAKYLKKYLLVRTKTTDFGSLFRLSYRVVFIDVTQEKQFIDELRTKNGNLEISILPFINDEKVL